MTPEQLYQLLEPSFVDALAVDPRRRSVTLDVRVENQGPRLHKLVFEGVARFLLDRPGVGGWELTELSEIVVEPTAGGAGTWRFWADLWGTATLEIHAERILLDGDLVREAAA
jgi:hypothetical protein